MAGLVSLIHNLFVLYRELHEISFSTHQTFVEHLLCAWQGVQCCDNKATWLGTPFAKTLEEGPVRHVEV